MPDGQLYAALGVSSTATAEEIKAAYRKLALERHPDRNPGDPDAETKLQVLNAAYEVLGDPERRRRYDETGDEKESDDVDLGDFMSAFMHGAGMFGGGWRQEGPRRGPDAIVDLDLTLEELYTGATKQLNIERSVRCGVCSGSGGKANAKRVKCSSCGGEGYTYVSKRLFMGVLHSSPVDCAACRGTGKRFRRQDECPPCKGKGLVPQKRELDVKIEAGQSIDEVIELAGEADEAPDAPAGNLILRLHALSHPTFSFAPHGNGDLLCNITLTLSEALLGFSRIVLIHLDGKALRVNQPGPGRAGFRVLGDGDTVKIAGKGMPSRYGKWMGDLHLRISIEQKTDDWLSSLAAEQLKTLEDLLPSKRPQLAHPADLVEDVKLQPSSSHDNRQHEADPDAPPTSCAIQ